MNISKMIIDKHGGHIGFIRKSGIETTSYVVLPELMGRHGINTEEIPRRLIDVKSACILIIENDAYTAVFLQRMLTESRFNSYIAHNINQACQLLSRNKNQYKLIILDLILPGGGIHFLEELRNENSTQHVPVIVISVKADES